MKNGSKKWFYLIPVFFVALFVILYFTGVLGGVTKQNVYDLPDNTKIAIPHFGAYSCQAVGSGSPTYSIGSAGFWVDKSSIGVYTDEVRSLNVIVPQTFWDSYFKSYFGGGIRAAVKVCDVSHNGCVDSFQGLTFAGTTTLNLPFTAFNPNDKSVFVVIQSRGSIFSSWSNDVTLNSNAKIGYAFTKYGLKYVSTTGNPAGSLFGGCESSCDLTCPEQKSRSDTGLIYTVKNSLLPTESVPVLEYWEDLNPDLNSQFGATIYSNGLFCFGGVTYSSKTLTLDNGEKYIYPDTTTRKNKECCPGAVTSTSTEDKTCLSDYTWKTVTKDTRLKCVSDFNCPGQGQFTCQNLVRSGWGCDNGFCVKGDAKSVDCCSQADCPSDQTCQNYKCVGGNKVKVACPFGCCIGDSDYVNKPCPADSACVNHGCVKSNGTVNPECRDLFGGLVPTTGASTANSCGFAGSQCWLWGKGTTTVSCGYNYSLAIILGVIVIVLLFFAYFMTKGKGGKPSSKKSTVSPKNIKWLIIALIVAAILYFFWAYLLIVVIILIVLSLVDTFVLGGVIKKIIIG